MPETEIEPEPAGHKPDQLPSRPKRWRSHIANTAVLIAIPLAALCLILFVFQSYAVSGVSMENTLHNNDRLIVWKLPRTWARITGHQYVPKRGDIVIINQSNLSACDQTGKQIVKRVIGLPGDHVVYKNGAYTVYNAAHPNGFDPDTTLAYGKADTALFADTTSPDINVTLSKTQLFVSGDHRADSCDSRYFGPIQTSQIIGKLAVRLFPLSAFERF